MSELATDDGLALEPAGEPTARPEPTNEAFEALLRATAKPRVFGDTRYTHVGMSACACTPGLVMISGRPDRCTVCGGPHDPKRILEVLDGWVYVAEGQDARGRKAPEYRFAPDAALRRDAAWAQEVLESGARRRMQGGCLEQP